LNFLQCYFIFDGLVNDNYTRMVKLELNISPREIIDYLSNSVKFILTFLWFFLVFLCFSFFYGINDVIKATYILEKPTFWDVVVIYGLNNMLNVVPFIVIFSLFVTGYSLFRYKLSGDVIKFSVVLGLVVYIIFFVSLIFKPTVDKLVRDSVRKFSTSQANPSMIFVPNKIHVVEGQAIIPINVYKGGVRIATVRNQSVQFYTAKISVVDEGIKLKSDNKVIFVIPYEKIVPSSYGLPYEKLFRASLKISSQFSILDYIRKMNILGFINLMLYSQALSLVIVYLAWIFKDESKTKVILLSLLWAVLGVTLVGFFGSIFEFMASNSLLKGVNEMISGIMAFFLSVLIIIAASKVNSILKGKVGV